MIYQKTSCIVIWALGHVDLLVTLRLTSRPVQEVVSLPHTTVYKLGPCNGGTFGNHSRYRDCHDMQQRNEAACCREAIAQDAQIRCRSVVSTDSTCVFSSSLSSRFYRFYQVCMSTYKCPFNRSIV